MIKLMLPPMWKCQHISKRVHMTKDEKRASADPWEEKRTREIVCSESKAGGPSTSLRMVS
jgi:hypothetical protein